MASIKHRGMPIAKQGIIYICKLGVLTSSLMQSMLKQWLDFRKNPKVRGQGKLKDTKGRCRDTKVPRTGAVTDDRLLLLCSRCGSCHCRKGSFRL